MKRPFFIALWSLFFISTAAAQINTERMMIIGQNALYFDDYVLSIQYFNQVIKAKPHLAEPYFFRAAAKLYLDDNIGSEEDCTAALERNSFMVRAYLCRSYARMRQKKFVEAAADCEKGLEFDIDNQTFMLNRAISLTYAKKFNEALSSLNALIRRYPSLVEGYTTRAQLYVENGDTLSAIDDFSRAISVDRFYAPAHAARGWLYLTRNNFNNALSDLDEAIRLEPENANYYLNRGFARYNKNNLRGTLEDFDRSITLNPNFKLAYYNRGLIRSQVGDVNRAIEDFDKVVLMEPDNYMAIYNRGILQNDVGEYKKAVQDFTTIIKTYPNFVPALRQRSEAYKKMGDAKGADRDFFAAFNLEEKLKQDKSNKKKASKKSAVADSTSTDSKRDLDNFDKVISAETDLQSTTKYQNPMRGRVQDKNTEVQIEDLYYLSFYEKPRSGPYRRVMDFNKYLTELSDAPGLQKILITNQEQSLTTEEAAIHFKSIDTYSSRIAESPNVAALYLARSVDFAMVQDLSNAIEDLTKALSGNDRMVLAYFQRANLRFKKMKAELATKVYEESQTKSFSDANKKAGEPNALAKNYAFGENVFGLDLDLVMRDIEHVLTLDPNFVFAYYNRANIRFLQRDYRNALADYSKALEINPEFADAWFNRGITQINLGDKEHGLADLRMAGQLGMFKAYNIIKRYE